MRCLTPKRLTREHWLVLRSKEQPKTGREEGWWELATQIPRVVVLAREVGLWGARKLVAE